MSEQQSVPLDRIAIGTRAVVDRFVGSREFASHLAALGFISDYQLEHFPGTCTELPYLESGHRNELLQHVRDDCVREALDNIIIQLVLAETGTHAGEINCMGVCSSWFSVGQCDERAIVGQSRPLASRFPGIRRGRCLDSGIFGLGRVT